VAGDRRRALYVALAVESWVRSGEIEARRGAIAGPYLRFCAVESSSAMQNVVAELERQWPGTIYSEALPPEIFECSWWNPWAPKRISVNLAHAMVGKYLLLADTTRAVLRAKELRSAGAGPSRIDSTAMDGATWDFEPGVRPATFTLRFSRGDELECRESLQKFRAIAWTSAD
jgi:hypothetical protein